MTKEMPRVVQTNTSQNNINDEDENAINANTNTTERSNETSNASSDSRPTCDFHDRITTHVANTTLLDHSQDLYSLRCVVDGKVKLFKKDSRVWLHKSSAKGKRKPDRTDPDCGDAVFPVKIGKFDGDASIKYSAGVRFRQGSSDTLNGPSELVQSSVNYNSYRSEFISDLSSLGDSDADLTYSEESTPTKTPSYSEEFRPLTKEGGSDSGDSLETNGTQSQDEDRLAEFCEPDLNDEVKQNSESLESLDICNESGNNVKCFPRNREISRKIAPAIEIEDESIRENLLDYAVNMRHDEVDELQTIGYFTRSASKLKDAQEARFRKMVRPNTNRSNTDTREFGYNLRQKPRSNKRNVEKQKSEPHRMNKRSDKNQCTVGKKDECTVEKKDENRNMNRSTTHTNNCKKSKQTLQCKRNVKDDSNMLVGRESSFSKKTSSQYTHSEDKEGSSQYTHSEDNAGSSQYTHSEDKADSSDYTHSEDKAGSSQYTHSDDKAGSSQYTHSNDKADSSQYTHSDDKTGSSHYTHSNDKAGSSQYTHSDDKAGSSQYTHSNDKADSSQYTHSDDKTGSSQYTQSEVKAASSQYTHSDDKADSLRYEHTENKAGCSYEYTLPRPLPLLYLATLALVKDSGLSLDKMK